MTDRTVLRRLAPADLADFQHYRHDEEVGRYQGWVPQTDAEATVLLKKYSEAKFFQPIHNARLGCYAASVNRA